MWRVLRPDAVAVMHDERARAALPRYFAVVEGKLPARFQVCKRVNAKADLSAPDAKLWKAHEKGMLDFRRLISDVDMDKVKIDNLEKPKVSLIDLKTELARRVLKSCRFCERQCRADRTAGKTGFCGVGEKPRMDSEFMHHGEEPELVPSYTIFFNGCTFQCQYCQNWEISQFPQGGTEVSPQVLARLVEGAWKEGARNVNWVGGEPTPNLHAIIGSLGLCEANLPSVWNSNMYLSTTGMRLLSGTQDIYLMDFKYGNDRCAQVYSKAPKYLKILKRNQILARADAEILIRHLVLPNHIECCTRRILNWIATNLGKSTRINLMNQYRPEGKASEYAEISRPLLDKEFAQALELARDEGLENLIT